MYRVLVALLVTLHTVAGLAGAPQRRKPKPAVAMPGRAILADDFEKGIGEWSKQVGGEMKWVQDKAQARGGEGCVVGSVTKDRQANFLQREVPLRTDALYRFTVWARSDKLGKLVLWAQHKGQRVMFGSWQGVTKRWKPYSCQFSVQQAGPWRLQVILPSSHGAPPCTMWVDDLALLETRMPRQANLTASKGYNLAPALATDGAGTPWLAWTSHRDGQDELRVGRLAPDGDTWRLAQQWPVAIPKGSYVLDPVLCADAAGAWMFYAGEVEGDWSIHVARVAADGPSAPRRFTAGKATEARPAATLVKGKPWVAWEGNADGIRQVYLHPADAPEPLRLSQPGISSYSPAIATHAGEVWAAWHAFADGTYSLFGRRVKPDGSLGPIVQLTRDGNAERHARLLASPSGLWVAWQKEIKTVGLVKSTRMYRTGTVNNRETWLARWTPAGLQAAAGLRDTILPKGTEMPSMALDAQGRVWVTARRARSQSVGWDSVLQCFAGAEWGEARHLSSQLGWDGRAGIACVGSRILVAYQGGKTQAVPTVQASLAAKSDIFLATVSVADAPAPAPPQGSPLSESTKPHYMVKLRTQLGEDGPHRTIAYQGQKLGLFWGDLHEHTSLSQCGRWRDMSPDDNYASERDVVHADFSAMTDHGYNFCPALWHHTAKIVRVNHDPGRFVTFLGEEWTSTTERYSKKYPEGYYGHRNLIFASPYFPRWFNARNDDTPQQIWDELRKMKANFVQIPHQLADTGNVPVDWDFNDKVAQPVAEIFQARQSYEYKGAPRQAARTLEGHFIQDAWARGIVIGVIASPDHGGGQGKAAVYAPELTREDILDALRARRCYGTTAARIFLDVRVNGHLMGEEIAVKATEPIVVNARAIGANDVEAIELCRSNQFIYTKPIEGREADFTFRDLKPLEGKSYYYVRVRQKDGELAWSSPVWVTRR
ncbi:MAG: CehA/McbA family metallohydrolase [Candidatus Brocadiae bacterium]|nr:CehA/McbA family metallohydrolase [Candidatus Brocadiia bacterium]